MFSQEVEKALKEAGWYSGRKVDIRAYIDALANEGYDEVPQVLKDFLSEFGGLVMKQPHFVEHTPELLEKYPVLRYAKPFQEMHFDPIKAIGTIKGPPMTKEDIYEERVDEDMILFGEISDNNFLLMMTPTGKVYRRDVDQIAFLGNNYKEMLENIYHRIKTPEIP